MRIRNDRKREVRKRREETGQKMKRKDKKGREKAEKKRIIKGKDSIGEEGIAQKRKREDR